MVAVAHQFIRCLDWDSLRGPNCLEEGTKSPPQDETSSTSVAVGVAAHHQLNLFMFFCQPVYVFLLTRHILFFGEETTGKRVVFVQQTSHLIGSEKYEIPVTSTSNIFVPPNKPISDQGPRKQIVRLGMAPWHHRGKQKIRVELKE